MNDIIKRATVAELLAQGGILAAKMSMGADSDDELNDQCAEFETWLAACEDKAIACKIVIKALESDALRHKAAEEAIRDRRKSIDAQADKLRERTLELVCAQLEGTGAKSIKTDDGGILTVTTRTSLGVEVTDAMALPEGCGEWIYKPDLTAIKAAYKVAGVVPGAVVSETVSKSLSIK
jgi:hypothetical protein